MNTKVFECRWCHKQFVEKLNFGSYCFECLTNANEEKLQRRTYD